MSVLPYDLFKPLLVQTHRLAQTRCNPLHTHAPAHTMPKWDDMKAKRPVVKAGRARLYDIVDKDHSPTSARILNKEGLRFNCPLVDLEFLGEYQGDEELVTPTEMAEHLRTAKGFLHISFLKADRKSREMYGFVRGGISASGCLPLQDLEKDASEHRQCKVDRVYALVLGGKRYVLKKPAYAKLFKA